MSGFIEMEDGRWNPAGLRSLPKSGQWSGIAGRAYSLMAENRCLATVRQRGRGRWHSSILGFEWKITPDMPTAKFAAIPSSSPLTHTPVKGFATSTAARKAVDDILARSAALATV